MVFTTIQFWAAFIAFLFFFALLRKTKRELLMLYVIVASLGFFYLSNGWLMLLLPATAIISWMLTEWMSGMKGGARKWMLFFIVLLDLLPLLFFKYAHPLSQLLEQMLATNFSLPSIALPIGISFYTFQAISYTVDIYRRDFCLKVSFLEYLLYLSFFPLLLAGPITRAKTFFPQVRRENIVSERLLYMGLWLIILGIIKKAIVADYIAQYNDWIFTAPDAYSGFECLMGLLGFSMQIYLDFSGYSDISIGIAAMMGIRLCENFAFPYRSRNLTEFWHRWHISLSTWFRDYLYIPLGAWRQPSRPASHLPQPACHHDSSRHLARQHPDVPHLGNIARHRHRHTQGLPAFPARHSRQLADHLHLAHPHPLLCRPLLGFLPFA